MEEFEILAKGATSILDSLIEDMEKNGKTSVSLLDLKLYRTVISNKDVMVELAKTMYPNDVP